MKVLGINDGHNAAACLYEDGQIIAAVQEERFRRVKNWAGMPVHSINFVLRTAGITPAQIDGVALNGYHAAYPMTREQLIEEYRTINNFDVTLKRKLRRMSRAVAKSIGLFERLRERRQSERVQDLIALGIPRERIRCVEHHTAHASAAYYGWGNFSDEILVLTADGSGDGVCASVSIGRHGRLERLHQIPMKHSLGNIYAMVTFLMGMTPLEHEYKLMGLAPYAEPKGAERVFQKLMALIRFDPKQPLGWEKTARCPETYCSYRFFRNLFERDRFDWIAGGLQRFTETILSQWVRNCVRETGIERVALGGGIFMNVKANKLIMELPEVKDLFIYPSCGDETNAMGAAYHFYAETEGVHKMAPLRDLFLGSQTSNAEVEQTLRQFKFQSPVRFRRIDNIERKVAELLAAGCVVARHSGHEEFGARALGNRSILANPKDPHVVRIINEAIKSRDFWMPFALSILSERVSDYIVNPKKIPAPYMILTFDTTDRRSELAAAIHPFDFTVRPQVVENAWNPKYHTILREFEKLTGIGGILNTSFNLHGFPIASSPSDSLDVFDRSGLPALAIENWLIEKT
jgi:carbamoyltransferase